jgi:subtilisin family serine protease
VAFLTSDGVERLGQGATDGNGHGTHVAGIVGAGGVVATGVAPGVGLGAYRVFGCDGSTHSDVVLAAVERAFADGMDVVNLSLGSNNGWPQDFSSQSLSRMMDFGMVPVASAGNNGANGTWTIGAPGAGADVITVASVDNTDLTLASFTVDGESYGYAVFTGSDAPPTSGTSAPISFAGLGCSAADFAGFPAGNVALVNRGVCAFGVKHAEAVVAGASAVLIANNAPGLPVFGTLGGSFPGQAPALGLSQASGAAIQALLGGDPVALTWTDALLPTENATGFLASSFSSYGLAPDLSLKPDLAAPGGFIYSSMIVGAQPGVAGTPGYEILSGTSMAAPHVAGAVALLLEARPDVPPHRIRDLLQNSAVPVAWFGGQVVPGVTLLESVHRQGAGLIDVAFAAESYTYASPAKLSLGETADGPFADVITIRNDSGVGAVYALGQIEAFGAIPVNTNGLSWQNPPGFGFAPPLVEYFELRDSGFFDPIDTIAVPAGGVASFQVRVTPNPEAPDTTIQGTYLAFDAIVGGEGVTSILVPAAGYVGDYQALPTAAVEPLVLDLFGGDLYFTDPGFTYTMEGEGFPFVGIALLHGAQTMSIELVPVDPLRTWMGPQPAFEVELVRRNNTNVFSAYGLGDFDASVLPNGAYRYRMTLLKAGGDATNPAHYEVLESDVFYIDRTFAF